MCVFCTATEKSQVVQTGPSPFSAVMGQASAALACCLHHWWLVCITANYFHTGCWHTTVEHSAKARTMKPEINSKGCEKEQGTSRPPWGRSAEYHAVYCTALHKKSEHSLHGKSLTMTPFFTVTEYRSALLWESLSHCNTSPTSGFVISLH